MPYASTYTLDRDHVIVASDDTYPMVTAFVGRNVFAAFPGLERAVGDLFDVAWRNGCHGRVIHYAGSRVQLCVVRDDDLDVLNVWVREVPLDGLKDALDAELTAARQAAA